MIRHPLSSPLILDKSMITGKKCADTGHMLLKLPNRNDNRDDNAGPEDSFVTKSVGINRTAR
jgi:hypothetical protein